MSQHRPLAPLDAIPAYIQTIHDYQQQAQRHVPEDVWGYLNGGAMHELSVQNNCQQFQNIQLIPRHLNDLTQGNTRFHLFGLEYPHPIFLAPIGHQALFHPQAEAASALAAEVMQSNIILSTFSNTAMDELTHHNPYKWFQLYWQGSREKSSALIKQAEQSGYRALVITVDAPHVGIRDRERKLFFQLPKDMQHPHTPTHLSFPDVSPSESQLFQGLMQIAPKWSDIAWVIANTQLPVILKGILHPADAQKALDYGVAGIIVSNHGGRIVDTTISPLIALEKIRAIVPADYPVLFDGGIRRGTDVFKAIALGANAVLIGRPYIYGLATAGALGVAHVIRMLKEEFEITMALMGTATIKDINQDYIYRI
ncbi:alpha-hydroxy acid oxidase [Acinetobacter sp. ANC 4805]|uniref:alpha-hydroxy acid oxidase n=1 Tax=Acinetobacter sp. ANC 4805 TaxID=2923425 RepID=UPI001F4BC27E|nr:alpha-hydroxy acid oxidase [Acinetobacter sp. ANC 4805]MCH7310167.1 alpha-hydroxy-acid oxidizing protein [Acinetobacter sp. ANC 4805]